VILWSIVEGTIRFYRDGEPVYTLADNRIGDLLVDAAKAHYAGAPLTVHTGVELPAGQAVHLLRALTLKLTGRL
jgi:hypothetical protein